MTPGIHYAHAKFYYRTIRVDKTSPLIEPIRRAGFRIEESVYGDNTLVVYFPVKETHFDRSKDDVSIWEQVENIAQMQHYWADNQVSATVTFKPEEARDIPRILELYETRLKSVSFLPLTDHNYPQAPYQTITEEAFTLAESKLSVPDFSNLNTDEAEDIFCDGDKCQLPPPHEQPQTEELPLVEVEEVKAEAEPAETAERNPNDPVPAK